MDQIGFWGLRNIFSSILYHTPPPREALSLIIEVPTLHPDFLKPDDTRSPFSALAPPLSIYLNSLKLKSHICSVLLGPKSQVTEPA